MQDKTDAAGYGVSGLAGLLGLATTDFLMVAISAIVGAGTLYLSYWAKKAKLKEEQRRTDAAIEAERAKADHYRRDNHEH